jgi:hypothetical protein
MVCAQCGGDGRSFGYWPAVVELLSAAGHDVVAGDLRGSDIDCDISDPDTMAAFGPGQRLARKN